MKSKGLENGPVAVLRACAHKYTDNCLPKFTPRHSANNRSFLLRLSSIQLDIIETDVEYF